MAGPRRVQVRTSHRLVVFLARRVWGDVHIQQAGCILGASQLPAADRAAMSHAPTTVACGVCPFRFFPGSHWETLFWSWVL
eukprot:1030443-Pyramimonas_sp.AAC.1